MKRVLLAIALLATFASGAYAQSREAVLDSLQYTGFRYFWDEANPTNGLVKDRNTAGSVSSIAATGFGLSAICVASDHGWISRAQARTRVFTTLSTFWNLPQGPGTTGVIGYKGLYYHWLDMNTGLRRADWNSELSTIDTALLFAGIIDARQYFNTSDATEVQIRAMADSITRRADWTFVRHPSAGIYMGWNPSSGFSGFGRWIGYNEAMIMYILAIGSPTHPIPATDWNTWTSGYNWSQPIPTVPAYVTFPPLFGHQYSHCWIDFRGIADAYMQTKGITYFENSRRATLAQIQYARSMGVNHQIVPTFAYFNRGFSDSLWGFTASDDPTGYVAHGAPNGGTTENGTITPTAPISSYPFAPDSVWPCVRNLYNNWKVAPVWGKYGFTDAFNPVMNPWVGQNVLGIDQGPIVLMIENARNSSIWTRFMSHPDIAAGLTLAGFHPIVTPVEGDPVQQQPVALFAASPNPFRNSTVIRYRLPHAARVRLDVFDVMGRHVAGLVNEQRAAGTHSVVLNSTGLAAGVYQYRLDVNGQSLFQKAVLIQ